MKNMSIGDTAIYLDAATGDKTPVRVTSIKTKFGGDLLDFISMLDPDETYEDIFETGITPSKVMSNRYGDYYWWEPISEGKYRFQMTGSSMEYGRRGGKEGTSELDNDDLGMFDPSGGPYISLGAEILPSKWVSHIAMVNGDYIVTTSEVCPP
jgi:hypothetical protein